MSDIAGDLTRRVQEGRGASRTRARSMTASESDCACKLEALRVVRLLQGLSLKAAADRANISATYLQKLERGDVKSPSPHVLHQLAEAYNYPYARLMELAGYIYPDDLAATVAPKTPPRERRDQLEALADAIGSADLSAEEAEFIGRSLKEYREAREAGVQIPPTFLSTVLRTYHRLHAAGTPLTSEDVVPTRPRRGSRRRTVSRA